LLMQSLAPKEELLMSIIELEVMICMYRLRLCAGERTTNSDSSTSASLRRDMSAGDDYICDVCCRRSATSSTVSFSRSNWKSTVKVFSLKTFGHDYLGKSSSWLLFNSIQFNSIEFYEYENKNSKWLHNCDPKTVTDVPIICVHETSCRIYIQMNSFSLNPPENGDNQPNVE
jgi:hypothetical protein